MVTVFDLWPFLVMAKGPAWQPGPDLLAVPETAADIIRADNKLNRSIAKYEDTRIKDTARIF